MPRNQVRAEEKSLRVTAHQRPHGFGVMGSFSNLPLRSAGVEVQVGILFQKRFKALSQGGPSTITKRRMTSAEKRAYHHIYDEPDSETVVMTWPRSIPLKVGDRGWADMQAIERRLPEFKDTPTLLLWAPGDEVFPIEYAHRFKELLPHAEGPILFDRAKHFLQDDRGPDLAAAIVDFLGRIARSNGTGLTRRLSNSARG